MDDNNLKIARYLTGALFLALAIASFLQIYLICSPSEFSAYTAYSSPYVISCIVSAFGAAIIAVSMFRGMCQVFIVGAGFQAVSCLIELLALHKTIVNIFSAVLLLAGYVLAVFAVRDKKNASKYEIVSVVSFLIGTMANSAVLSGTNAIMSLRRNFVSVASPTLLACIVLENTPQAQTAKMVKQPTKTAKSDNRIEELTKLKDLLDTGVISQEEFDAKKKQILEV